MIMPAFPESVPLLYVVRHGRTLWNDQGRFQGLADIDLNDEGRAEAVAAGLRLRSLLNDRDQTIDQFDILSSRLIRAQNTAEILCQVNGSEVSRIRFDQRLGELSFGEWEGMTTLEVKSRFPALRKQRKTDRWNFRPPGGESYADATPRIKNMFLDFRRPSILVCHTGVMRIILHLLGKMPESDASIHVIGHGDILIWSDGRLICDESPLQM
ncbi:histidine phosphatase family protein [Hoeflea sp. WL0058]|uniref:phosphoglycerate mutase (2,3-diphosphoglycerate-dependent) n=1 Tax=Flavimaribacter sediminis TaxID=2865987 RepID=A0AAE2ZNT7_9HYPH|nr:histidine phosphatase family protein [Flavimaribacter sediminis]MBW8636827.1 histidine phosphatase family protein [Flavimaribacter sediminis]